MADAIVSDPRRQIRFDTVFNFRDLGGYPTVDGRSIRWRRLFRADGLHRLRPTDGDTFRSLGIRTVIDLRTWDELETRGRFPAEVANVDYHHLPMFDVEPDWPADDAESSTYLADRYIEILEAGRPTVAAAVGILSDETVYPLVFHCAAGKDRTGILAALILSVLGVPDDLIASDYALSHEAMGAMDAWLEDNMPEVVARIASYPPSVLGATVETMLAFLERLRQRHGGAEDLLRDLGVDDATTSRVRKELLTER